MNFGDLKTYVIDVLGRSDIPNAAYAAAQSDWDKKLQLQGEQVAAVLASPYLLPDDFVSFIEIFGLDGSTVEAYRVTGNALEIEPDTGEDLDVLYVSSGAKLVNPGDTNTVLTKYEAVAIYGTLYHTCVMLRDSEGVAAYGPVYASAIKDAKTDDHRARFYGGQMIPTPRDSV